MSGETEPETNTNKPEPKPEPPKAEEKSTEKKTYTEDEVQAILQGRLSKYKDFDTLKDKASKYDKAVEANQSEAERLTNELNAIKEQNEANAKKYQNALRKSSIVSEATKLGAVDP